ncbi:MAG: TraR/DksA C4-type zinc finger protein [bacterium]
MANKTKKTSKAVKKRVAAKSKAVTKVVTLAPKKAHDARKTAARSTSKIKASKPVAGKVSKSVPINRSKPLAIKVFKSAIGKVAAKKVEPPIRRKSPLDQKMLQLLKDAMIKMRDRLTGQISAQSDDSLKYVDDTSSEDRTDDFDKEFALNMVSSEHDSLFEIDNALRRIAEHNYGFCDGCNCAIEKPRLQALPFARMCIRCQSEQEKGRTRFRPFGDTLAQGVEQAPEVVEQEEAE